MKQTDVTFENGSYMCICLSTAGGKQVCTRGSNVNKRQNDCILMPIPKKIPDKCEK